jgi:hypothetical protein
VETEPTRKCALLIGLPDVSVVGVGEWPSWLRIVIATELTPPVCGEVVAHGHGVRHVELVDLPVFGRPTRLGVAQAALELPVVSTDLDRTGPADRLQSLCDDDAGGALGDGAGRPPRPHRGRGGRRSRL